MAYASLSKPKVIQNNMGDHNQITKQMIATTIRTFFGVMADPLLNDCRLEFFSSRLLIIVVDTNSNFFFCTTGFFTKYLARTPVFFKNLFSDLLSLFLN